jgi:tRNA synthetases class I (I, L, M and V)
VPGARSAGCLLHEKLSYSVQAPGLQVLKDIIVKYQLLAGRKAKYVPGWDCHGLPIELKVPATVADNIAA